MPGLSPKPARPEPKSRAQTRAQGPKTRAQGRQAGAWTDDSGRARALPKAAGASSRRRPPAAAADRAQFHRPGGCLCRCRQRCARCAKLERSGPQDLYPGGGHEGRQAHARARGAVLTTVRGRQGGWARQGWLVGFGADPVKAPALDGWPWQRWTGFLTVLASSLIGAWRGLVFELLSLAGWVVFLLPSGLPMPPGPGCPWASAGCRCAMPLVLWWCLLPRCLPAACWPGWPKSCRCRRPAAADRALGRLFGVLRGLLCCWRWRGRRLAMTPLHEAPWWQESQLAPWMQVALKGMRPALPEEFGRHLPS